MKVQVTYDCYTWECPHCECLNVRHGDGYPITDRKEDECVNCGMEVTLFN